MDQETTKLSNQQSPHQETEPGKNLLSNQKKPAEKSLPIPKFSNRVSLKDLAGQSDLVGEKIIIGGWVKSSREIRKEPVQVQQPHFVAPHPVVHKEVSCAEVLQSRLPLFRSIIRALGGGDHHLRQKLNAALPKPPQLYTSILQINDGSCIQNFQVLVESTLAPPSEVMPMGVCILVEGTLQQLGEGKEGIELKADNILHLGTVDESKYPLSKKRVPLEMLRDSPHYRPRTKTVASVMRIRNALTQAKRSFFDNHGFIEVQVPIITTTDAQGFSNKFQVTTLLEKIKMDGKNQIDERVSLETLKASIQEKREKVEELRRSNSNKEALVAAVRDLKNTTELVSQVEKEKGKHGMLEAHKLNFAEEYFSRPTFLTVSGRLHLASYACALGNVYSFGPRFRADKSESKKSVAEMWMVELEMAFSELKDAMECAEALLKSMCSWVSTKCSEDITFISKRTDRNSVERLQLVIRSSFKQISYTEAVNMLQQVTQKKFQEQVQWGNSLTEEHESYLVERIFNKVPVVIYNHPKDTRPFYARLNDDGKTVASFDVVVPKVGTLIQGSQNEERLNVLRTRMKELSMSEQEYEWCLDLRRHGTVKHSGFSLGFELLVLYATGLNDVRDSVPFPRNVGRAFN